MYSKYQYKFDFLDGYQFPVLMQDKEEKPIIPHHITLFTEGINEKILPIKGYLLKVRQLLRDNPKKHFIPIILGEKKGAKKIIIKDISEIPHILIAGSTGSGKTTFLENIIMTQFTMSHPRLLKILLLDGQGSSFSYLDYLDLLTVINPKEIPKWIKNLKEITKKRILLIENNYVKSTKEYNELAQLKNLPYIPHILVIFDEFQLFAMSKDNDKRSSYEELIELTAITRKAGIHFILSTQTPYSTIISGMLKACMRGRISFKVCTPEAAEVCFNRSDLTAYNKLEQRGELYFYIEPDQDIAKPIYISTKTAKKIAQNTKKMNLTFKLHK